jgi:hypothetical protein
MDVAHDDRSIVDLASQLGCDSEVPGFFRG